MDLLPRVRGDAPHILAGRRRQGGETQTAERVRRFPEAVPLYNPDPEPGRRPQPLRRPEESVVRDDRQGTRQAHQHGLQRLLRAVRRRQGQALQRLDLRHQPLQGHLPGIPRGPHRNVVQGALERLIRPEVVQDKGEQVRRPGQVGSVLHRLQEH